MNRKEEAFDILMQQVLAFIEKFKFIDKAIENLCKTLCKTKIETEEFTEMMKLYNTTGQMFIKALTLMDSIISRFPQELSPDELEFLEEYRKLSEADKFIFKTRLKHEIHIREQ